MLGRELINSAKSNVPQNEKLISENHLQWHSVNQAMRDSDSAPTEIHDMAFNLLK